MRRRLRRAAGRLAARVGVWCLDLAAAWDPVDIPPDVVDRMAERMAYRFGLVRMGDKRNGHHKGGGGVG